MRYSVLIPTKNRLSLLRLAIQSVLDQDYGDWEIVVSDNAPTEPVAEYVSSLQDARLRYTREEVAQRDIVELARQFSPGTFLLQYLAARR